MFKVGSLYTFAHSNDRWCQFYSVKDCQWSWFDKNHENYETRKFVFLCLGSCEDFIPYNTMYKIGMFLFNNQKIGIAINDLRILHYNEF